MSLKLNLNVLVLWLSLFIFLNVCPLSVQGQGGVRFRQPFNGPYRITSYGDHDQPGVEDGQMFAYTGEQGVNCVKSSSSWGTQSPFCYDSHRGTDWALPDNTPVLAAASGIVNAEEFQVNDENKGYGNYIVLNQGSGYYTLYAHLSTDKHNNSVSVGQAGVAGQQLALKGDQFKLQIGSVSKTEPACPSRL